MEGTDQEETTEQEPGIEGETRTDQDDQEDRSEASSSTGNY